MAIISTRRPSLDLRFGSCERHKDAPLGSPFKEELTMPNSVSAVNSSWPINLHILVDGGSLCIIVEAVAMVSPPFLLDTLQASKPAFTEIFLDNLDKQVKILSDGEAFGHFPDDHPLLIPPRNGRQESVWSMGTYHQL